MSNYLAVATVTAALKLLISRAIADAVPGSIVTTNRPDKIAADGGLTRGVNLYLFLVSTNPHQENRDLPTRSAEGHLRQAPVTSLDLHYMATYVGDEVKLEPQLLLGATMAAIRREPILTPSLIAEITDSKPNDPPKEFSKSTLKNQNPRVTVVPENFDVDEVHKLWSVFSQVPYHLSTAFRASPVLIESDISNIVPVESVEKVSIQLRPSAKKPSVA